MSDLREAFEHGYRSEPETVEGLLANAAGAALSIGTLVAGTIIAARRFNEDRNRLPALLTAGLLGTKTVATAVEARQTFQDLADVAADAALTTYLFRSRDS